MAGPNVKRQAAQRPSKGATAVDTPAAAPSFDVIIAGGGPAGILAAARLAAARPGIKIALVEREPRLGGRLRTGGNAAGVKDADDTAALSFSYGLNGISDALFGFWNETLKHDPDAPDLVTLATTRQQRAGVLAGNRINAIEIDQWFTAKGARTLGGFAASRQWPDVEEVLNPGALALAAAEKERLKAQGRKGASKAAAAAPTEDESDDEENEAEGDERSYPFSHYWKSPRKAPAAVVVEHFASAYGIPDIWTASVDALRERSRFHSGRLHSGVWDDAIAALLALPEVKAAVTVFLNTRVVNARRTDGVWTVDADGGAMTAKSLVVAMPPWIAVTWLPRTVWPPHVLQIASKTKPVSAVILSERLLDRAIDLPDVVVVPSERAQIVRTSDGEVTFQATIDFELSLQAPAVVKAVKALKRARKKLLTLYPGCVTETNKLALQTVAWAQSPSHADRRVMERMEKKAFNTASLSFCGDAYGGSYDGDANVLSSVISGCGAIAASITKSEPVAAADPIANAEPLRDSEPTV